MANILVVDDQDRTIELCRRVMPEHEWVGPARSWSEANAQVRAMGKQLGLVLLDIHFDIPVDALLGVSDADNERSVKSAKRRQGIHILEALRRSAPDLPVVLMTNRGGAGMEQAADRHGAQEYTYFLDHEDVDAHSLRGQVEGILRAQRGTSRDGPVYWGRSIMMRQIRQRLSTLARGRLPVTLTGPTGTGKSLIARHFIHPKSGRKGKFVSVDLATLPKDLVAAHLFGSLRGAYTGSVADRAGAFEQANGGTLFLDEIGNLSIEVQKMLLTVLQEGVVTRLGDTNERTVDVKLVVATNEDLADLVGQGRFRSDLYMRLNPASAVRLPSLQERALNLAPLLTFTLERILAAGHLDGLLDEYRSVAGVAGAKVEVVTGSDVPAMDDGTVLLLFPAPSMEQLSAHRWPGNLREFSMAIENALTLSIAEAIAAGGHKRRGDDGRPDVIQVRPKLIRDQLMAVRIDQESISDGLQIGIQLRSHSGLNKVAQDIERQYFTTLYLRHQGDFAAMASILLGDADASRKVQLRFNQLGLKVRDLKERMS